MAEDIFGVDCDFGVFAEDDDEEDIEDYEEEDEEEGGQEQRRRKPKRGKRIFEMYEPSELEARHFTDKGKYEICQLKRTRGWLVSLTNHSYRLFHHQL